MKEFELIAIFPVGYPADEAKPSERHTVRRSVDEAVSFL